MTKRLLMLALIVTVAVSGAVLSADSPARADSCYGGCSMAVPGGGGVQCRQIYDPTTGRRIEVCDVVPQPIWISTNCVKAGPAGPCYCPYEGQGLPLNNGCPDPKP